MDHKVVLRTFALLTAIFLLALASYQVASAVTGAAFTTVNETVDGSGHCKNGNPAVNCNIYDGKQYVWLTGGPVAAALGDGTYFFAVLVPGGQADPNDGAADNLSDVSPTSNTGAGDTYLNRLFTISGGSISYSGNTAGGETPHTFNSNKIRLMPYDDTTNPGGVYILAICSLGPDGTSYPVAASACKYDAFKVGGTAPQDLSVSKTAAGSYDLAYTWGISKQVDKDLIKSSDPSATVNYTVKVTHDSGTVSNTQVSGNITVTNPNAFDVLVNVSDAVNDANATCLVNGVASYQVTVPGTVPGPNTVTVPYTCTYSDVPTSVTETNTVTITWTGFGSGTAQYAVNFTFDVTKVDDCVNVTDKLGSDTPDTLGKVCVGDAGDQNGTFTFTYSRTLTGTAGTCTDFNNTAQFVTNTTGTTGSASQEVTICTGANLTVAKTANPEFTRTYSWDIAKAVDKTLVKQVGGTATFNYTVTVTETKYVDSDWKVTGTITITNPNDWEDVTTSNIVDAVDNGGSCTVDATTVTVPKSGSKDVGYTCTYSSAPDPASGTNTATVSWDASAAYTPDGSAKGTKDFTFDAPTKTVNKTVNVTDTFNGSTTNLGSVTAVDTTPYTSKDFKYSRSIPIPSYGCLTYPNTAKIVETGQTASTSVTVCGPVKTGALTMGFWQNKNGQAIITGQAASGVCPSAGYLTGYAPFQDLSSSATCAQVATYVTNVIKAANASGASMNAMLKAQMLSTALDVYFSSPALGGNKINAPAPVGDVVVDLTYIYAGGSYLNVSAAFGGATSMKVKDMLSYAAGQSNVGGSVWYGNVKSTQELAKDAFDAINNQWIFNP